MRNVAASKAQCAGVWLFCPLKRKNVARSKIASLEVVNVWTWTAIDSDTKLIFECEIGDRSGDAAVEFMNGLRTRLADRVQQVSELRQTRFRIRCPSGEELGMHSFFALRTGAEPATAVRNQVPTCPGPAEIAELSAHNWRNTVCLFPGCRKPRRRKALGPQGRIADPDARKDQESAVLRRPPVFATRATVA